ncbi:phosphonate ABC transporter, permease protein PhnE [Herbidospora daliensis]|uniref:phosphonate ABC transporter, permease protein PhnE n=1 Tax=Herbidospora daliensis TaxID=295585 RepID=UPI0007852F1F|nr:phosphonate ABC transporter, permease protein PhnE [Herbidospora daliensis]
MTLQQERVRTTPPPPEPRRGPRVVVTLLALGVIGWSVAGTGIGLASLIEGREGAAQIVSGLFPPDLDADLLGRVVTAAVETVQISVAALVIGVLIGLPLAVLMAGNVQAPRWLSAGARTVATTLRSVHELLWALLFVATVGLGPAAGVYAIALHSAGVLAKLCSEQLEAVDPGPVEAMRLTGGSRTTTALLGIVPQARAVIASQILYQWECNIRSSVVIGFVGAGGIGQALGIALHLFRYQELATLMASVVILVIAVDRISKIFRGRLGAASERTGGGLPSAIRSLWRSPR